MTNAQTPARPRPTSSRKRTPNTIAANSARRLEAQVRRLTRKGVTVAGLAVDDAVSAIHDGNNETFLRLVRPETRTNDTLTIALYALLPAIARTMKTGGRTPTATCRDTLDDALANTWLILATNSHTLSPSRAIKATLDRTHRAERGGRPDRPKPISIEFKDNHLPPSSPDPTADEALARLEVARLA